MDEKQLKALWESMSSTHELGNFDAFKKNIYSDSNFRKGFWEEAAPQYEIGDYKTFEDSFKKKVPLQPSPSSAIPSLSQTIEKGYDLKSQFEPQQVEQKRNLFAEYENVLNQRANLDKQYNKWDLQQIPIDKEKYDAEAKKLGDILIPSIKTGIKNLEGKFTTKNGELDYSAIGKAANMLSQQVGGGDFVKEQVRQQIINQEEYNKVKPSVNLFANQVWKKMTGKTVDEFVGEKNQAVKDFILQKQVLEQNFQKTQVTLNKEYTAKSEKINEKYKAILSQAKSEEEQSQIASSYITEMNGLASQYNSRINRVKKEVDDELKSKISKAELSDETKRQLDIVYNEAYKYVTKANLDKKQAKQDELYGKNWYNQLLPYNPYTNWEKAKETFFAPKFMALGWKSATGAMFNGISNLGNGLVGLGLGGGFTDFLRGQQQRADRLESVDVELKGMNWLKPNTFATRLGKQLGFQAPIIAATALTKNPFMAGTIGFGVEQVQNAGEVYNTMMQQYDDPIKAQNAAKNYLTKNLPTLPLYFLESEMMLRFARAKPGVLKNVAAENLNEVTQELIQGYTQQQEYKNAKSLGTFLKEDAPNIALETALTTTLQSGLFSVGGKLMKKLGTDVEYAQKAHLYDLVSTKGLNAAFGVLELKANNNLISPEEMMAQKEKLTKLNNDIFTLKDNGLTDVQVGVYLGLTAKLDAIKEKQAKSTNPQITQSYQKEIESIEKKIQEAVMGKLDGVSVTLPSGSTITLEGNGEDILSEIEDEIATGQADITSTDEKVNQKVQELKQKSPPPVPDEALEQVQNEVGEIEDNFQQKGYSIDFVNDSVVISDLDGNVIGIEDIPADLQQQAVRYEDLAIPKVEEEQVEEGSLEKAKVEPIDEAKKLVIGTKVSDDKGEPIVVYHGTQRDFENFELPSYFGDAKYSTEGGAEMGMTGKGIFFSSNEEAAKTYSTINKKNKKSFVKKAYLDIKNPYIIDAEGKAWTGRVADDYKNGLRNPKYDGVIVKNVIDAANNEKLLGDVYAVKDPSQIKIIKETPKAETKEQPKPKQKEEKLYVGNGLERAEAKRLHQMVKDMPAPTSADEIALRYIADGGTIGEEAINEVAGRVKRARLNTGERELKTNEAKARDYYRKEGETLDDLAHRLWEKSGQEVSEIDIKDALMTAIRDNNTRLEASKAYLEKYSPEYAQEKYYERIAEEKEAEYKAEQERIAKLFEQEAIDEILGLASQEHINNLINQYEAEFNRENQEPKPTSEAEVNKPISGRASGEENEVKQSAGEKEVKSTIPKSSFDALIDRITKAFPKVKFFYDEVNFNKKMKQYGNGNLMRTPNGTIYGATFPDGSVYINQKVLSAETPIHEASHIWEALFPKEWKNGIELFRQSKGFKKALQEVQSNKAYKNKTLLQQESEALNTLIGRKGEGYFQNELLSKFNAWLQKFFNYIGGKFGIKLSPDTKLNEFVNDVIGDILGGKEIKGELTSKEVKFQIIGENAELAEEVRENLQVARKMEIEKKDAKTIRLATGWERGIDGKWRYEIEDVDVNDFAVDELQRDFQFGGENEVSLQSLIGIDNALIKAYPQLGNIRVIARQDLNVYGIWVSSSQAIELSPNVVLGSQKNFKSILIHEIQHAIQDIEGFAKGGNEATILEELEPLKQKLRELNKLKDVWQNTKINSKEEKIALNNYNQALDNFDFAKFNMLQKYAPKQIGNVYSFEGYKALAGEAEARNVQKRLSMTPEQRKATTLQETEDVAREEQVMLFETNKSLSSNNPIFEDYDKYNALKMAEKVKNPQIVEQLKAKYGQELNKVKDITLNFDKYTTQLLNSGYIKDKIC